MTVNCFQISDDLQLLPCDYGYAFKAIQEPGSRIWIDLQGAEKKVNRIMLLMVLIIYTNVHASGANFVTGVVSGDTLKDKDTV